MAQHEFAAFCMKYPGESRYQMAAQGSELIVGLGKMYLCAIRRYEFRKPKTSSAASAQVKSVADN